MAFNPDGHRIAIGSTNTVDVFETTLGKEVSHIPLQGQIQALAFSPDNRWIAGATAKSTGVFDAASGKELWHLARNSKAMAFYPNSKRLAAANEEGNVRVFSILSGKDVPGVARYYWAADLIAFSPDGRWMATSFRDKTTRLIAVASGKETWHIRHHDVAAALAFSADSRWLATGTSNGAQQVFSIAAGNEVSRTTHPGVAAAIVFDPASRYLDGATVTEGGASAAGKVAPREIWLNRQYLYADDLIRQACSRLQANLTSAQWKQYLGQEPYRKTCPNLPVP